MKSPIPPGKKGQNLIEYALLLAIITSIGFYIYDQSGPVPSIRTVFNQADSLLKTGARISPPDYKPFLASISSAIRKGTWSLKENEYVHSGTRAGDALAKKLGIPYAEGDAWSLGRLTNEKTDLYVLVYYSAADNGNYPISKFKTGWDVYGPGHSKLASHGKPLLVAHVTKYGFNPSTGEESNEYVRSSAVFGYGTTGIVVKGPEGKNTVRT